jgi:hypothetical protein
MAGLQRIQQISKRPKTRVRQPQNLPQTAAAELKVKGGSPNLMLSCNKGQHLDEATLTFTGK